MRIGILGGTGPAGTALGARLASVGYEIILGSRSRYRAMEARDEIVAHWTDRVLSIDAGSNTDATQAELVVIATPWDSAATTAHEHARCAGRARSSSAWPTRWSGWGPSSSRSCRLAGRSPPTCRRRCRTAGSWRRSTTCRPRSWATWTSPSTPTCSSALTIPTAIKIVSEIVTAIPGCRPLDAGELSNATAIEAFTAVLLQLNVRYRTRVAPKLTGIKA